MSWAAPGHTASAIKPQSTASCSIQPAVLSNPHLPLPVFGGFVPPSLIFFGMSQISKQAAWEGPGQGRTAADWGEPGRKPKSSGQQGWRCQPAPSLLLSGVPSRAQCLASFRILPAHPQHGRVPEIPTAPPVEAAPELRLVFLQISVLKSLLWCKRANSALLLTLHSPAAEGWRAP